MCLGACFTLNSLTPASPAYSWICSSSSTVWADTVRSALQSRSKLGLSFPVSLPDGIQAAYKRHTELWSSCQPRQPLPALYNKPWGGAQHQGSVLPRPPLKLLTLRHSFSSIPRVTTVAESREESRPRDGCPPLGPAAVNGCKTASGRPCVASQRNEDVWGNFVRSAKTSKGALGPLVRSTNTDFLFYTHSLMAQRLSSWASCSVGGSRLLDIGSICSLYKSYLALIYWSAHDVAATDTRFASRHQEQVAFRPFPTNTLLIVTCSSTPAHLSQSCSIFKSQRGPRACGSVDKSARLKKRSFARDGSRMRARQR